MMKINIDKVLQGKQGEISLSVDLNIEEREFVVIMGESGSGKTSLLRAIAGLEEAQGEITFNDKVWLDAQNSLSPQKRGIGFMFQDYALFDNMTVEQNLLFVNNDTLLANELLAFTSLAGLASRSVKTLSGGQKQRVSLCRALMSRPKLLLLDEPFSALDEKMKSKLQEKIKQLHQKFAATTLMVSHDAKSAYLLADKVLVLKEGKVVAYGKSDEILQKEEQVVYALKSF